MTVERKRTEWIDREIDIQAHTVTFIGKRQTPTMDKPEILWTEVFHWDKAHIDNNTYAIGHGYAARLGDKTALPAGATLDDRRDAIKTGIAHFESGTAQWAAKGTRAKVSPEALLAKLMSTPEGLAAIEAQLAAARAKMEQAAG